MDAKILEIILLKNNSLGLEKESQLSIEYLAEGIKFQGDSHVLSAIRKHFMEPFSSQIGGMNADGELWDGELVVDLKEPLSILKYFYYGNDVGRFSNDSKKAIKHLVED